MAGSDTAEGLTTLQLARDRNAATMIRGATPDEEAIIRDVLSTIPGSVQVDWVEIAQRAYGDPPTAPGDLRWLNVGVEWAVMPPGEAAGRANLEAAWTFGVLASQVAVALDARGLPLDGATEVKLPPGVPKAKRHDSFGFGEGTLVPIAPTTEAAVQKWYAAFVAPDGVAIARSEMGTPGTPTLDVDARVEDADGLAAGPIDGLYRLAALLAPAEVAPAGVRVTLLTADGHPFFQTIQIGGVVQGGAWLDGNRYPKLLLQLNPSTAPDALSPA